MKGPRVVPDSAKIWHYTSLPSLLSILQNRQLWFTTLAALEDPMEGSTDFWRLHLSEQQLQELVRAGCAHCWQVGSDSDLMWKVYAPNFGVAIESTPKRLKASFLDATKGKIQCEPVDYVPKLSWPPNPFSKRRHFREEREYRAYLPYEGANPTNGKVMPMIFKGRRVAVDPVKLIRVIWVSPHAPDWFEVVLKEAIATYGYSFQVTSRTDGAKMG